MEDKEAIVERPAWADANFMNLCGLEFVEYLIFLHKTKLQRVRVFTNYPIAILNSNCSK